MIDNSAAPWSLDRGADFIGASGRESDRMPNVVVGVPVLNGARFLERCLLALVAQDYPSLGILVSDNASDDATPEIAARFAASDARVRVVRQSRRLPVTEHFRTVRDMADCRYFAWRAHDDWSDADWISTLAALLEEEEDAQLAVSRIVGVHEDGRHHPDVRFPEQLGAAPAQRLPLLRAASAAWIYGLFRHAALVRAEAAVDARYPHVWSRDLAVLMRVTLAGGVVGSNATCFYSQVSPASRAAYFPTHWRDAWRHYADFLAVARDSARAANLPLSTALRYYLMLPGYTRGRTEKLRRIARGWLSERLGGTGLTRRSDDRKSKRQPETNPT